MFSFSKLILTIACTFLMIFSFTLSTQAQGIPSNAGIDLSLSTDNPIPGQTVTITARSYTLNINSSKLVWTVGGKVVKSGVGETVIDVIAPKLGSHVAVKITAITTDNIQISQTINISSGYVDMIIETDGYVPPFYRGKTPIVYQNSVKVIAIPHVANSFGVEYDPKSFVYAWKKNSKAIEDQSGYGKQSVTLLGDIVPRPYDLSVVATTRDGSTQALGIITIAPSAPSIGFYVDDPLYGTLFNSAINNVLRIGKEKEDGVLAVPFGFNIGNKDANNLSLAWTVNGNEHPDLASNKSIILRAPGDQAGSSNITLDVRNEKNILQGASGVFSVLFSADNATNTQPAVTF